MSFSNQISLGWATPILQQEWMVAKHFEPEILACIRAWRDQEPGRVASNVGGWRSCDKNLEDESHPALNEFTAWLRGAIRDLTTYICPPLSGADMAISIKAWANICKAGDYHAVHTHSGAMWSGVYYVITTSDTPDRPTAGCIEFLDPRPACGMVHLPGKPFGRTLIVHPKPGLLLLFPAWLPHGVHPVAGSGERISISFNCVVGPLAGCGAKRP